MPWVRYTFAVLTGLVAGWLLCLWGAAFGRWASLPAGPVLLLSTSVLLCVLAAGLFGLLLHLLRRRPARMPAWKGLLIASMPAAVGLILYTALNAVAGASLGAELARIKAAGETLSLVELAGPLPPEGQNAAPLLEVAFRLLVEPSLDEEDPLAAYSHPRTYTAPESDVVAVVDRVLARNEEALAFVQRALERPRCHFGLDYGAGLGIRLLHLSPMRRLGYILSLRAQRKAQQGNGHAALEDVWLGIRLSRTLDKEPMLISWLVELSILQTTLNGLEGVLQRLTPSAQDMSRTADLLETVDVLRPMRTAMIGERAVGWQCFRDIATARLRLSDLLGDPRTVWPGMEVAYGSFWFRPLFRHDQAVYLRHLGRLLSLMQAPYPPARTLMQQYEQRLMRETRLAPVSRLLVPALTAARDAGLRAEAKLGAARLALAAVQFRAESPTADPPASLADLSPRFPRGMPLDPFTRTPFVYRRTPQGAVVYSVGPNGRDDGGVFDKDKDDISLTLALPEAH